MPPWLGCVPWCRADKDVTVSKGMRFALWMAVLWMLLPLGLLRLPLWNWPIPDWPLLTGVIVGFVFAFALGGTVGIGLANWMQPRSADAGLARPLAGPDQGMVRLVFMITIVMNALTLVSRAGFNPFNCGNILECSNAAYQGYVEGSLAGEGALFEYMRILMAPVIYAGLAMSIWCVMFEEGKNVRGLAVLVILSEIVISIATGTSRSIANVLIFGIFVRSIKSFVVESTRIKTSSILLYIFGSIVMSILFFLYFSFLQINREGFVAAVGILPFNGDYIEAWSFQTGNESFLLKGLESVVRYLCTGYFSLSLGLGLTPGQSFPLGSSMFLAQRAKLGGDDSFITHSLPGQIESHFGWSYLQQWHSLFAWLLSDYSFAAVAFIMALLGFIFSLSAYVALTQRGAFAKLPFFMMFIVVLYVPANNQIFQAPETALAFLAAILVLLFKLATGRSVAEGVARAA